MRLRQRHAELHEIVTHRAHQRALGQAQEARALAKEETDAEMAEFFRSEAAEAEGRAAKLEKDLELLLLPKDPNDDKNVVVESGQGGGQEAALFAGELLEMYRRYAERRRWKSDVLSSSPSELGGFKEACSRSRARARTPGSSTNRGTSGPAGPGHRVRRTDSHLDGNRGGQAEGVEVRVNPDDLEIDVFRSSGPGGQSVNTTDSAVRVTHKPTGIVISVREERSQRQNREEAMRYLRARLLKLAQDEQQREEAATRKAQVGSGERSGEIRTTTSPRTGSPTTGSRALGAQPRDRPGAGSAR